ncbi:MAG: hypothetical protein IJB95_04620, partial [Clostridia bacterium]|nr:hypothetical protein [Clostridia bacterium]
ALPKGEPFYCGGFPSKHKQYPMMSANSRVTPVPTTKCIGLRRVLPSKAKRNLWATGLAKRRRLSTALSVG